MTIRLFSFLGGAIFGSGGAILVFCFVEKGGIHWGIVGISGLVMGCLSVLLGKKFWDTAVGLWP